MLIKILVILILLLILASLGSGLAFMIKDRGHGQRTVKALTVRIALSIGLFILLLLAYVAGLITPHGLYPARSGSGGSQPVHENKQP